jgi:hypothetical protein
MIKNCLEKDLQISVGTMKMTKSVKYSLMALRVYLIFMIGMVFYSTFVITGILH